MEGIIGLLILIADIYAIIQIIQSSAEVIKKTIWIVLVLVLPVLGFIAWFFLGPRSQT